MPTGISSGPQFAASQVTSPASIPNGPSSGSTVSRTARMPRSRVRRSLPAGWSAIRLLR